MLLINRQPLNLDGLIGSIDRIKLSSSDSVLDDDISSSRCTFLDFFPFHGDENESITGGLRTLIFEIEFNVGVPYASIKSLAIIDEDNDIDFGSVQEIEAIVVA
ncbi:unnamed protein product [Rotaria sp. Silwood1]|nr:unnamed protein product [Rotaria sp. Silwood1]